MVQYRYLSWFLILPWRLFMPRRRISQGVAEIAVKTCTTNSCWLYIVERRSCRYAMLRDTSSRRWLPRTTDCTLMARDHAGRAAAELRHVTHGRINAAWLFLQRVSEKRRRCCEQTAYKSTSGVHVVFVGSFFDSVPSFYTGHFQRYAATEEAFLSLLILRSSF